MKLIKIFLAFCIILQFNCWTIEGTVGNEIKIVTEKDGKIVMSNKPTNSNEVDQNPQEIKSLELICAEQKGQLPSDSPTLTTPVQANTNAQPKPALQPPTQPKAEAQPLTQPKLEAQPIAQTKPVVQPPVQQKTQAQTSTQTKPGVQPSAQSKTETKSPTQQTPSAQSSAQETPSVKLPTGVISKPESCHLSIILNLEDSLPIDLVVIKVTVEGKEIKPMHQIINEKILKAIPNEASKETQNLTASENQLEVETIHQPKENTANPTVQSESEEAQQTLDSTKPLTEQNSQPATTEDMITYEDPNNITPLSKEDLKGIHAPPTTPREGDKSHTTNSNSSIQKQEIVKKEDGINPNPSPVSKDDANSGATVTPQDPIRKNKLKKKKKI
jgi:hypothetical protein